jgi:hypothetical protein
MSNNIITLTSKDESQLDNNIQITFLSKGEIIARTETNLNTLNNYIAEFRPTENEARRVGKEVHYELNYLINLFNLRSPQKTKYLTSTKPKTLTNNESKNNQIITELNLKVKELESQLKTITESKDNIINLKDKHILTVTEANQLVNERVKELIQANQSLTESLATSQQLQAMAQSNLKDAINLKNLLPEHIEAPKVEIKKKRWGIF